MTLLAELVAVSEAVARTSARSQKVSALAELLARLAPEEVPIAVAALSGEPRQGRIGVGYAQAYGESGEPALEPSLTVTDLDRAVDELAAAGGPGSGAERRRILAGLYSRATAEEGAFVRALLTGGVRQGALAGVMVDAVARAAGVSGAAVRRALMLSGDLPRTAALALTEGEPGLRDLGFELFRPLLPMLASPATDVRAAMDGLGTASVEWKLDGIRIQVHRDGDEVRVYTRNLNEIGARLPGVVSSVRALPVSRAVLDGEALWMEQGRPAPFQETVAQIDAGAPPEGVVAFFFDVLHLEGRDLLDLPLEERVAALSRVAPELRVPATLTSDPDEAERVLAEALAAGHEGIVVKDAGSTYTAGRRGKTWRKVKPVLTYDLVVLAAEWGHGRRRGRLSNLHLGARDPAGGFVMVGKTFKGLTDQLLEWQTRELLARQLQPQPETSGLTLPSPEPQEEDIHRAGAVFVRPELVVEIALDGVQASTRYPGGVALRFARVKRYRPDKGANEADTIETLQRLLPRGG